MNLRKRLTDSRVMFQLGMMLLILFNASHFFLRGIGDPWRDAVDGLSGFALGAAIGLLLLSIRRRNRDEGGSSCA